MALCSRAACPALLRPSASVSMPHTTLGLRVRKAYALPAAPLEVRIVHSRCLPPCRSASEGAAPGGKQGDELTAALAANFNRLLWTDSEGRQHIAVDQLLDVCGKGAVGPQQDLVQALQAAVRYAQGTLHDLQTHQADLQERIQMLRATEKGGGGAVKEVASQAVSHAQRLHDAHTMQLKELLEYASHELEPKAGPPPALQLAMRQLRDRISDKLSKHVSAVREIDDLRHLAEACEAAQGSSLDTGDETARD